MSTDNLDIRQSVDYEMTITKDRTLKQTFECVYYTGTTTPVEVDFEFMGYSGATLNVKKTSKSSTTILDFDTSDNSIVLSTTGNTFQLIKTDTEVASLQVGTYEYDMYLKSTAYPKRGFLRGKFIITDRITQ